MTLLLIITDYGSFNNFLSELAAAILKKTTINLHVICSRDKVINVADKEILDGGRITFHYINIPRRISLGGEWRSAVAIRKVIDHIQPDLIHAHFTTATFPVVLLKNRKYNYWATIHGLGMNASSGIKKVIFTIVECFCFYKLNRIFTINEQDFRLTRKYFGEKVEKYQCLGVGSDLDKFNLENFTAAKIEALKADYNIGDQIIIAFTGRFVHFKGFHLVVKSFQVLSRLHPEHFKLILIGGPDPIHPTGLNQEETRFLMESKDIINIGFTNNVAQYLALADVFLFPSKKEGLPTCILEALAMGLSVVTFDERGNNDIIKDGYNGLLIPIDADDNHDTANIVKALISLVANKEMCEHFRKNALKDRNTYSRERFVNEQLNYYDEFNKYKSH